MLVAIETKKFNRTRTEAESYLSRGEFLGISQLASRQNESIINVFDETEDNDEFLASFHNGKEQN